MKRTIRFIILAALALTSVTITSCLPNSNPVDPDSSMPSVSNTDVEYILPTITPSFTVDKINKVVHPYLNSTISGTMSGYSLDIRALMVTFDNADIYFNTPNSVLYLLSSAIITLRGNNTIHFENGGRMAWDNQKIRLDCDFGGSGTLLLLGTPQTLDKCNSLITCTDDCRITTRARGETPSTGEVWYRYVVESHY